MSAAAQNNPEITLGRHCQSFTLIDPYAYPLEQLCLSSLHKITAGGQINSGSEECSKKQHFGATR
jgi:hypothetical protein